MNTLAPSQAEFPFQLEVEPRISNVESWTLKEYEVVDSTTLVAAGLAAWEAVRADRQNAGRGRFQRSWVSDEGGLWLSAVVPIETNSPAWRVLPLATGLAVSRVLRSLGVENLRLRWPNDVLVGNRKLAGLLIDQFTSGLAVVGIGVNVRNRPESHDHNLRHQTARLAEIVSRPHALRHLTILILRSLRTVVNELEDRTPRAVIARVNELWGQSRRVELYLDGEFRRGVFEGVDENGRLILIGENGDSSSYDPQEVNHLKELPDLS
jgi:BirA family transcriptional regulator, biotin operon repressor / biotin---[acetyl-CoA-carboxylase] ligase